MPGLSPRPLWYNTYNVYSSRSNIKNIQTPSVDDIDVWILGKQKQYYETILEPVGNPLLLSYLLSSSEP